MIPVLARLTEAQQVTDPFKASHVLRLGDDGTAPAPAPALGDPQGLIHGRRHSGPNDGPGSALGSFMGQLWRQDVVCQA